MGWLRSCYSVVEPRGLTRNVLQNVALLHNSVEVLKMPRRLLSVPEAMACTGLGRSNFFNKIASGEIRSVKVGKRRLIPDTAIDEYIEGLEAQSDASSGVA